MTINLTPEIGSNFCYAPWTNIHINPQGDYKTCCAGTNPLVNLRQAPMQDALNNPVLDEIKQALLNNQEHPNCKICINSERHTAVSERTWYTNIAENKVIPITKIDDQVVQNLDIRWNNTCNLSCVYCGGFASSIWAQLERRPLERVDYGQNLEGIIDHINKHRGTIKNLGLLGGEPLLQKENEALLDIIDNNVHVNVITNLSVPLEKNKIFKRLVEMDNVTWDISFETVGDRFEYVRHGASWAMMLHNIELLRYVTKDKPRQSANITGQYSIYNCLNLSDVIKYFIDHNMPMVRWNELTDPSILSPFSLPDHLIKHSIAEITKALEYAGKFNKFRYQTVQQDFFTRQITNLQNTSNPNVDIEKLYTWHSNQEQRYWPDTKLKFEDLWPEFRQNTP